MGRRGGLLRTSVVWMGLLCFCVALMGMDCLAAGDKDGDGVLDKFDNCPNTANLGQFNDDKDTLGNACDNCPKVTNEAQIDSDNDR